MAIDMRGVVLGISAPNRAKDGRVVQCAIVYEDTQGLVRIFADYRGLMDNLRVWNQCVLRAEKTKKDSRNESWKLLDLLVERKVTDHHYKRAVLNRCIFDPRGDDHIRRLNDEKRSIGVLVPPAGMVGCALKLRDPSKSPDGFLCQRETDREPHVSWRGPLDRYHDVQLGSHEAYEWIRKNPQGQHRLWENLQIDNPEHEKWFVLGNLNSHRSTWLVVHVHRLKKHAAHETPTLPGCDYHLPNPYPSRGDQIRWRDQCKGQMSFDDLRAKSAA